MIYNSFTSLRNYLLVPLPTQYEIQQRREQKERFPEFSWLINGPHFQMVPGPISGSEEPISKVNFIK